MSVISEYYGVLGFAAIAAGFSVIIDHSPLKTRTLSHAMNEERRHWMIAMAHRDVRIVDSQIIAGLQNGIAFFASTALLGIGAAFTLLTALDSILAAMNDIPALASGTRTQWEVMSLGLLVIYAYAFFKFGWAYRLVNYSAILMGSCQNNGRGERASKTTLTVATKAWRMNTAAATQFNRGLRALFFSIGYLAWIAGPHAQILGTALVASLLAYRQFASAARRALLDESDPSEP